MRTESPEGLCQPERPVPVLVVSPLESDHVSLRQIFSGSNWWLKEASRCGEALDLLRRTAIPIVICERDLPDGDWKRLLEAITELPSPPQLIVSSRLAEERLWAEVLNLGAYDLLATPFEPAEVVRVAYMAWQSWNRAGGSGGARTACA